MQSLVWLQALTSKVRAGWVIAGTSRSKEVGGPGQESLRLRLADSPALAATSQRLQAVQQALSRGLKSSALLPSATAERSTQHGARHAEGRSSAKESLQGRTYMPR